RARLLENADDDVAPVADPQTLADWIGAVRVQARVAIVVEDRGMRRSGDVIDREGAPEAQRRRDEALIRLAGDREPRLAVAGAHDPRDPAGRDRVADPGDAALGFLHVLGLD